MLYLTCFPALRAPYHIRTCPHALGATPLELKGHHIPACFPVGKITGCYGNDGCHGNTYRGGCFMCEPPFKGLGHTVLELICSSDLWVSPFADNTYIIAVTLGATLKLPPNMHTCRMHLEKAVWCTSYCHVHRYFSF